MKIKNRMAIFAVATAGLFTAGQAHALVSEVSIDFTGTEGYTNGPLQGGAWSGNYDPTNNMATVATNGTGYSGNVGTVSMESPGDWHYAVNNHAVNMGAAGNSMTVSTVFKFNSVAAAGANNRDMMGVRFYDDATGGTFVRTAFRRRADGKLQLFTGLNGTGKVNPSSPTPTKSEADLGLASLIDVSDWLRLTATLTRGNTASEWTVDVVLSNLTANTEVLTHLFTGMTVGSELTDDPNMYGSFSSDYSDVKAGVTNRVIDRFEVYSDSTVPSETIVEWGNATNIVSANVDIDTGGKWGYIDNFQSQPTSGYNPDSDVLSPVFNATATKYWNIHRVRDGGTGNDAITFGANNPSPYDHMVVWNDFLGTNTTLSDLAMTIWSSSSTSEVRFVVQKGTGEWYASEDLGLAKSVTTSFTKKAPSLMWYKFNTMRDGLASVGALASPQPSMDDVATVGYWHRQTAPPATYGETRCFFFQAKAKPGAVRSDIIFSESFDSYKEGDKFLSGGNNGVNGFDVLNNDWGLGSVHTNASGGFLVHQPSSTNYAAGTKGWPWRGVMYTNGLPQEILPGDTLEIRCDYTMFAKNAVANQNGLDFYFSTNGVTRGAATGADPASAQQFGKYPDGQMGFRISQGSWINSGAWPDGGFTVNMNPASPNASDSANGFGINLNAVGITNLNGTAAADTQSGNLQLIWSALKTTNSGVWDVTFSLQNQNGSDYVTPKNFSSWTNQALYDATASNISFGIYDYSARANEEGAVIDNLNLRLILGPESPVVLSGWDAYAADYGITTGMGGDQDGDGENNWYEYVLGGDATNGAVQSVQPWFDGAGGYLFDLRGDATLSYSVLTNLDLLLGSWGTNGPVSVMVDDGAIHTMTNSVGTTNPKLFMKLLVE